MRIPRFKEDTKDFYHYSVGELSKNINIPASTIRSYDNKGIVHPSKRKDNEYRGYTVVDGNYILMLREYRNLGLSLSEAKKMLTDSTLEKLEDSLERTEDKLENEIFWLQKKMDGLRQKQARIKRIETNLNKINIVERPAMYRVKHQEFDNYVEGKNYPNIRKRWVDAMPLVYFTYRFPKEKMLDYKDRNPVHWGLTITEDMVKGTGLDELPYTEYLPPQRCIYTIISANNEVFCKPEYFTFVMEYLEKNNLRLMGDVYGAFICNVKDNKDGYNSYYEGYFPI